jgi:hypothetical protein
MDKLFNFFKEFMPFLEHYPAWARYLFGITLLLVLSSLFLFIILYPSASAKKKTEQTAAVINLAVSLLDDAQAQASDVSLGFECRSVLKHEQDRNQVTVRHNLSQDGGQIEPFSPYLSRLLRGDPITPLLEPYQSSVAWCPPNLDLRVVNNSDKSILVHTVVFEVEKSSRDYAPLIVMEADELWRKACHILLVNEGWGKIQNCSLMFNLSPIKKDQVRWGHIWQLLDTISFQGPFRHSVNIADFETSTFVNLTAAFISEDVKLDAKRIAREVTEYDGLPEQDYVPAQKDLGNFSSGSALVYGVLKFTSFPDTQNQTVKFAAIVHLSNSGLSGAAMPSSFQYHTAFQAENHNYQVSLPVSHNLKPGEADRFNIRVVAPQSSLHKFRVRLLYNQKDSVLSEPMTMRILVPRSVSQRLKYVPEHENK